MYFLLPSFNLKCLGPTAFYASSRLNKASLRASHLGKYFRDRTELLDSAHYQIMTQ
jgi:hypothetical protein